MKKEMLKRERDADVVMHCWSKCINSHIKKKNKKQKTKTKKEKVKQKSHKRQIRFIYDEPYVSLQLQHPNSLHIRKYIISFFHYLVQDHSSSLHSIHFSRTYSL